MKQEKNLMTFPKKLKGKNKRCIFLRTYKISYTIPIHVIERGINMEYPDDMKKRLRRIEGQARGVLRMMEEQKDCKDVVHQLSAIRSAVDRLTLYIVGTNMEKCMKEQLEKGEEADEIIKEAVKLLVKSR
jgi:DNA-binding FrmR family transcriptional regulator